MRKNDILNDFPELRKAHEEAVAFEKQAALDRHKYISVATKIIEQLNSASQRGEISLDRAWTYRIPRFLDLFKKIPRRTKADTVLFDDETRETLTVMQSEKIGIDTLLKDSWGRFGKIKTKIVHEGTGPKTKPQYCDIEDIVEKYSREEHIEHIFLEVEFAPKKRV